jgi:putative endonuclease
MNYKKQASLQLGTAGEALVKDYLHRHGFTIIAHNMRIQGGEIDLIAQSNDLVICVEVKTRSNLQTDMAELISPWQQQRIIRAAHHFLAKHRLDTVTCRFDVALIAMHPEPSLDYIPNAFEGD